MVRVKEVARKGGDQSVVDRKLDVTSDVVQVRCLAATEVGLEPARNVRDSESAPRLRVLLAPSHEQLGSGGECALVEALVNCLPRLGDRTTLVVRECENAD